MYTENKNLSRPNDISAAVLYYTVTIKILTGYNRVLRIILIIIEIPFTWGDTSSIEFYCSKHFPIFVQKS